VAFAQVDPADLGLLGVELVLRCYQVSLAFDDAAVQLTPAAG
jgi:hypothetical protein